MSEPVEVIGVDPGLGISGYGTTLQGSVSLVLGMIDRLNVGGVEVNDIDVTTMQATSTGDQGWSVFIPGLKTARDVTLDLVYENVNFYYVQSRFAMPVETWTITFPDHAIMTFKGYIKGWSLAIPHGDKMTQTVTIKMSGKPTFNNTGSSVVP